MEEEEEGLNQIRVNRRTHSLSTAGTGGGRRMEEKRKDLIRFVSTAGPTASAPLELEGGKRRREEDGGGKIKSDVSIARPNASAPP